MDQIADENHAVRVVCNGMRYNLDLSATLYLDVVEELCLTIDADKFKSHNFWIAYASHRNWMPTNRLDFFEQIFGAYLISDPMQIDQVIENLLTNLPIQLLPLMQLGETVKGMDSLLNSEPQDERVFHTITGEGIELLLAWQADNPRLMDILNDTETRAKRHDFSNALLIVEYIKARIS